MEVQIDKINRLLQRVELNFGRKPGSPTDFTELIDDIYRRTGKTIGISTVKRLWGYISSEHKPTYTTLSILSAYAGFSDWEAFSQETILHADSEFLGVSELDGIRLTKGVEIVLRWGLNKSCTLKLVELPMFFEVVEAVDLKLKVGDRFAIQSLKIGQPFITGPIDRGSITVGTYIGARRGGVSFIEIIKP